MQTYDIHGERIPLNSENIKPYIDQFEQQHEKIDTIILSTKTFTREAAKIMCAEIAKIKNLKNADLSDTISGLDYNEAQDVLDTFVNCLKELDINLLNLSDNAIGPEGINSLRPLITEKNTLEKLILMNDGLSGESCVLLSSIYKEIAPAPLKQLHFDNNMSGDEGAKAVADLLTYVPLLEDFRWSTTRTHEEGAIALSESLSSVNNLKKLYLADNYFGEECGELLYEAISKMKQLEHLVLSDISLENEGVELVLKALIESEAPIKYLDLSFNDLDEEILDRMTEFLMKADHLETLILHDNIFGSAGAVKLAKVIKKSCPQLKELDMENNELGPRAVEFLHTLHTEERPIHINIEDEIYDDVEDYDEIDVLCNEN